VLADLLQRLGVNTLGEFAALPGSDVLARFGTDGALAHRLAAGRDDRPLEVRQPPTELSVSETFDEPIERVDVAAFAARTLAVKLHERLAGHGLAATRLEIGAVTADGQQLSRVWRHDGLLSAQAIADRTRWQLEGWLTHRQLTAGITTLTLTPQGVLHQGGLQPGLWGEPGADRDRAHRAMHRVQGLLGPDSVQVGVLSGGRDPQHLVTAVPFGDERVPARPAGPWPAALPAPYPALTVADQPVDLLDADGAPVGVSARLAMTGEPARLEVGDRRARVVSWWGPWPVVERWWDADTSRRGVRLQVQTDDGIALLLFLTGGRWFVVGRFD
jgi:protein ImuB